MLMDLDRFTYYIRPGFTDMRKGPVALAYMVEECMKHDPFDTSVYLFCGQNRKTVKAIIWDGTGWLTISKKLMVRGPFKWPQSKEDCFAISSEKIVGLLRGNDVFRAFEPWAPVAYEIVK